MKHVFKTKPCVTLTGRKSAFSVFVWDIAQILSMDDIADSGVTNGSWTCHGCMDFIWPTAFTGWSLYSFCAVCVGRHCYACRVNSLRGNKAQQCNQHHAICFRTSWICLQLQICCISTHWLQVPRSQLLEHQEWFHVSCIQCVYMIGQTMVKCMVNSACCFDECCSAHPGHVVWDSQLLPHHVSKYHAGSVVMDVCHIVISCWRLHARHMSAMSWYV